MSSFKDALAWVAALLLFVFCVGAAGCGTPHVTINYEESNEDFVNPERGFYIPSGTKASKFIALDSAELRSYRTTERKVGSASYNVKISLLYRAYELDVFKDRPLSDEFLRNVQEDFDKVRTAGLKVILRFAYTNQSHSGNCNGDYDICPPYGDAPRHVVLNHIRQLAPLLQKNGDVIAVLQQGFIGIWGENYFTDYFGDASAAGSGKIPDSSWEHRNEVLKALLDAMPKNRMVQVRTPQMKQKFVYGASADVSSAPLNAEEAFNGSDKSRIGFHNDCFLASEDDYGTYYDNGSSSQPKRPANDVLRKFAQDDTKYTAVGGETCDDAFSPQNDCAPAGYAEDEMRRMHYSYLNAAYNNAVNNDWDSMGCMENIKRHLGYRLVLRKAVLPAELRKGESFELKLVMENKGYAPIFNPRKTNLILRDESSGTEHALTLNTDARFWFSGEHEIKESLQLPDAVAAGSYKLFLSFPDEAQTLAKDPAYSLRLANNNLWEQSTGYHDLNYALTIK